MVKFTEVNGRLKIEGVNEVVVSDIAPRRVIENGRRYWVTGSDNWDRVDYDYNFGYAPESVITRDIHWGPDGYWHWCNLWVYDQQKDDYVKYPVPEEYRRLELA